MHAMNQARARLRRRLARLVGAGLALAALWACGPVYIPVPPPEAMFSSELVTDAGGVQRTFWITTGTANENAANARFYIFDQERSAGVIATAGDDGAYQAPPMGGDMGDHVLVYYEDPEGRRSPVSCLLLTERRPIAEHCP